MFLNEENKMKTEKKEKKTYNKPKMEWKKSVAVISGSSNGCSYYSSRTTTSGTYYH